MIKAKPATNLPPIQFEWDEKFKVEINRVPRNEVQKMVKANEEIAYNKKHQRNTETNWDKFGMDFMRKAIHVWVGMTYRHLLDICQPIKLDPGVKLDDPIEFNEENLAFVLENYRVEFSNFVVQGADRINEIYAEREKAELENL